jgi:hypothetical protein
MLIAEQMGHQARLDSMFHDHQLKAISDHLQQHPHLQHQYRNMIINEQLQQQNLMRQHAGMHMNPMAALQAQQMAASGGGAIANTGVLPHVVTDSSTVAGKPSQFTPIAAKGTKRQLSDPGTSAPDTNDSKTRGKQQKHNRIGKRQSSGPDQSTMENAALVAMIKFSQAKSPPPANQLVPLMGRETEGTFSIRSRPLASIDDLLVAAEDDQKTDGAVEALIGIKEDKAITDLDSEDGGIESDEYAIAVMKGDTIDLPGFKSVLPQLPIEPEVEFATPSKKKRSKHSPKQSLSGRSPLADTMESSAGEISKPPEINPDEYPIPIDPWWPSVASIRKERKDTGDIPVDEDDFEDNSGVLGDKSRFRINMPKVLDRIKTSVEPGVLEKIPHCKIHRKLMNKRKNQSAPDFVFCWQVTELYPNDIMVCCSSCGSWRHAACGGHYKQYSVREGISTPFIAVCDRCHEEEKVLREHSLARARINRQRSEQIRRALATSACMRQISFTKHGGSYKWPLGSVSATHIGGHTRSVQARHDKAEKQWTEMANRLNKPVGKGKNQSIKIRTKELERLLAAVEDAGKYVWVRSYDAASLIIRVPYPLFLFVMDRGVY